MSGADTAETHAGLAERFLVDSPHLGPAALERKHRVERDPSTRADIMGYLPDMDQIDPLIRNRVAAEMDAYDPAAYTAADVRRALSHDTCTVEDFKALLSPAAEPFLEQMAQKARLETRKHFGNTVYIFTPLYIANYCENYCVYCGFNCYNDIRRIQLNAEQIEREMRIIADSGIEEVLLLTGESPKKSNLEYIGEACKLARKYFRLGLLEDLHQRPLGRADVGAGAALYALKAVELFFVALHVAHEHRLGHQLGQ
jgi:2-iminoacetate synthase